MNAEETKLLRQILDAPIKNGSIAYKCRDGRLTTVIASTTKGFAVPGIHFVNLTHIKLSDFQIIRA